jgi:hypothetical protein
MDEQLGVMLVGVGEESGGWPGACLACWRWTARIVLDAAAPGTGAGTPAGAATAPSPPLRTSAELEQQRASALDHLAWQPVVRESGRAAGCRADFWVGPTASPQPASTEARFWRRAGDLARSDRDPLSCPRIHRSPASLRDRVCPIPVAPPPASSLLL